jgi:lysozyme family protein
VPKTEVVPLRTEAQIKWRRTFAATAVALAGMGGGVAVAQDAGPAATAHAAKLRVLHRGDHGRAVRALQHALGLRADGVFGPRTRRAVRRFQRRHGMTVDGIAGRATLAALGLTAATEAQVGATINDPVLARIAQCESGGNPRAVSPDRHYRGKYQFTRATWRALGGHGDPAKAPEAEQDRRAAALLARDGTAPWPACA